MSLLARKLFKVVYNNLIRAKLLKLAEKSESDIDDNFLKLLDNFVETL